jgi:glycosyltransferase involved in cell wall biosynthesis
LAEGFGLPVIEAMYFGKPVFLAKLTSLPEIGGEEAFYFQSFDPKHMQEVLKNGLNASKSTSKSSALKRRAEKFSWKSTAKEYLKLYKNILTEL